MKVDEKISVFIDTTLFSSPKRFYHFYMKNKQIDKVLHDPIVEIRNLNVFLFTRQIEEEVLENE